VGKAATALTIKFLTHIHPPPHKSATRAEEHPEEENTAKFGYVRYIEERVRKNTRERLSQPCC
jgi:hypothetical protein